MLPQAKSVSVTSLIFMTTGVAYHAARGLIRARRLGAVIQEALSPKVS